MKKIEIRRHALKDSGPRKEMLSSEGIAQAEKVGESMRGKGHTHIATTPYFRTAQTACGFAKGAGDFTTVNHATLDAMFTEHLSELVAYVKEHGAVVRQEHPLIISEAMRMGTQFQTFVALLPDDAHLLAVGHSPLAEILVFGLTGEVISPLKECEGVVLAFDGNDFTIVEEIRL